MINIGYSIIGFVGSASIPTIRRLRGVIPMAISIVPEIIFWSLSYGFQRAHDTSWPGQDHGGVADPAELTQAQT